jgi:tRNA A-37 threonylcarbamoyl transferase component Bud32
MKTNELDQPVRVPAQGMRWQTTGRFSQCLDELPLEQIRHPEGIPEQNLVKDNLHRTVMRFESAAGYAIYLKRYKFNGLARRLKDLFRHTKAEKEWLVSRMLLKNGIPTCEVLAIAHRRQGLLYREAFLASKEIPRALPLGEYIASINCAREKHKLARELADLVVQLVKAGVAHRDLHAGNLMIDPDATPGNRIFVLDLHRVSIKRLWNRDIVHMCVYLADSTKQTATSTDRIRFLKQLLSGLRPGRKDTKQELRRWSVRIQRAWRKHHRRHMQSRTKRCLMESSQFTRERTKTYKIARRRNFSTDDVLQAIDWANHTTPAEDDRHTLCKSGSRTHVTRHASDSIEVAVKTFIRKTTKDMLKRAFRIRSRARQEWTAHRAFRVRGIPVPKGLALAETRSKLSREPDYLITEARGNMGDLQTLMLEEQARKDERKQTLLTPDDHRMLAVTVADVFRLLAEKGVRHRDMKPSNMLLDRTPRGFKIWLVDLGNARYETKWGTEHWIHHLAQCNAGLTTSVTLLDRMRCLRRCGRGRWDSEERLRIARAVLKKSLSRRPMWLRPESH